MLIFLQVFIFMYVIFRIEISFAFAQDTCNSNHECNSDEVCCKNSSSSVFQCRVKGRVERFGIGSKHRSCVGYYCSIDSDCNKGLDENATVLCCIRNSCRACTENCDSDLDCQRSDFSCCNKTWSKNVSGARYQYGKCVDCTILGCRDHSECPKSQYGCNWSINRPRRCMQNCAGRKCVTDEECAPSEHCRVQKCQKGTRCQRQKNDSCGSGMFCCKDKYALWYIRATIGVCSSSCHGNPCDCNNDCGPPGECCLEKKCKKCRQKCNSNLGCFNNAICCKDAAFVENTCASSCDKEMCFASSGKCRTPFTWCINVTCFRSKSCYNRQIVLLVMFRNIAVVYQTLT